MSYTHEFTLQGLPKMANQLLRGHWRVKNAHARRWKQAVRDACLAFKPPSPLAQATLTLTRVSSAEPDTDGLVSGFKHIVDGLVECGVLENDKPSNIGIPNYQWRKGKQKCGHVIVKVVSV